MCKIAYEFEKWAKRLNNRSDMTMYLTHLTKGSGELNSVDVIIKILNDRKLIGSTKEQGYIIGEDRAVCFQDTPLYGVSQNVYHETVYRKDLGSKVRYTPNGLCFTKPFVYSRGGRPCIYEKTDYAKTFINKSEWWRVVPLNLTDSSNIIDWAHEREWRVKGDLSFSYSHATVILGSHKEYAYFMKKISPEILKELSGITVLSKIL